MSSRKGVPVFVRPQLALLVDEAPSGDDWLHEIKYDGYRILAHLDGRGGVRLTTRNEKDWTSRFPAVRDGLSRLKIGASLLDGEVGVEVDGVTSFQALQGAAESGAALRYYVFDVLYLDGRDVSGLPLGERKALLQKALGKRSKVVQYSDHVVGRGEQFFRSACELKLEGIISKRISAPYRSGRGKDWVKVKCVREQEFVIGGFTEPGGSRTGLGALHVGAYEDGQFVYRGKVGTGFNERTLHDLRRRLEGLKQADSPFAGRPRVSGLRETTWVRPTLVAQIRFTELTNEGRIRHPVYAGLREDKGAKEVELEEVKLLPSKKMKSTGPMEISGARLTSPGKIMFPEDGITKLDLVRYYESVADWMLPHIAGRPLTLVRCPSGHTSTCFFQKHIDETAPPAIRPVLVEETDGPEWYGVVDSTAGLVSLVQIAALEIHTSNAREDKLDRPDRFVIDLDPDEAVGWPQIVETAVYVRDLLGELGLASFVRTTGGKGLHVVVPLQRRAGWAEVREFSAAVASLLVQAAPDRYTIEMAKRKRTGRILLDYARNTEGATAIESYSTRRRAGAPVAAPVTWKELESGITPGDFTVRTMPQRVKRLKADPWKDYGAVKQSLTAPMRRKLGL